MSWCYEPLGGFFRDNVVDTFEAYIFFTGKRWAALISALCDSGMTGETGIERYSGRVRLGVGERLFTTGWWAWNTLPGAVIPKLLKLKRHLNIALRHWVSNASSPSRPSASFFPAAAENGSALVRFPLVMPRLLPSVVLCFPLVVPEPCRKAQPSTSCLILQGWLGWWLSELTELIFVTATDPRRLQHVSRWTTAILLQKYSSVLH